MKILITGATGLVGKAIVELCLKKDIHIHYLTTRRHKIKSSENYKGFYWNPAKKEIDAGCFDGVQAIINLAGASIAKRWTAAHKRAILQSRLDSINTLYEGLQSVQSHSVVSFVSASGVGIYPNSLSNYYTEEETAVDKGFLGEVVVAWESAADVFTSLHINVAKIRIGLVLSLYGGALTEMHKTIKNYVGAAFGTGEQWQSWIHIDDLAQLFLFVVRNELEGVYNGVGPNPVTNLKLTKEIAKVQNKPLLLPNIPEFAMTTLLGEMATLLFSSQRVSSKKIEEEGFTFSYQNIGVALEHLYADKKKGVQTNKQPEIL
ncbi:TIGR01777 family oxidoreductase [Arenibacter sp. GZD96]|uniref:TIGR01777 family oxidoreductase n=1 Tax=Aurantibrevibacter litoralis TaxID=3106030 RepID=UPI002AFEE584|nr:TIGR01777 family oxidoreductase [Arenibacter sp. GZD-96]MEA1787041.1 TIGR01777 family oxidoreductase [Arenibacter sp. GZD-96]